MELAVVSAKIAKFSPSKFKTSAIAMVFNQSNKSIAKTIVSYPDTCSFKEGILTSQNV